MYLDCSYTCYIAADDLEPLNLYLLLGLQACIAMPFLCYWRSNPVLHALHIRQVLYQLSHTPSCTHSNLLPVSVACVLFLQQQQHAVEDWKIWLLPSRDSWGWEWRYETLRDSDLVCITWPIILLASQELLK